MGFTSTDTREKVEDHKVTELANFPSVPRQMEAWEALWTHRYILYGGARGGGKSHFIRWALILLLIYWYQVMGLRHVVVGLFCSTYNELQDRQISKLANFPAWLGEVKSTQENGLGFYLREEFGGGIIALRNLDKPAKYKSAEFAAIAVDELTLILKWVFDILRGSLRWPGIKHTIFIGGTNPDGIGNLWVRELWIERMFPDEMKDISSEFKFIKSLPTDNSHLDQTYWDDLRSQPKDIQKAWIEGDWYVFAGQAFKVFRQERHVVQPFEIPDHWIRITGEDWGKSAALVNLWGAMNPDNGRVVVYRELTLYDQTDKAAAMAILASSPPTEKIRIKYADPSIWPRKQADFPSTAEIYATCGLYVTPADNDRIQGKRRIDGMLADLPDGKPGLLIFETCFDLWHTLPALIYDKVNIEDVDTTGPDHWYDALRYLTSSVRPSKPQEKRKQSRSPIAENFR